MGLRVCVFSVPIDLCFVGGGGGGSFCLSTGRLTE